jgi:glucose/arabinose dehydrogenase
MKRTVQAIFIVALFVLLIWAGNFYWHNLRGALPAVQSPAKGDQAITDTNTTGIPLTLPKGFSISTYAKDLVNPRVMLNYNSNLIVSIPSEGKVVELKDLDGDGFAETHVTLAENLNKPHGLAERCTGDDTPKNPLVCKFYVAETSQVSEFDRDWLADTDAEHPFKLTNKKKLFDLPAGGTHSTRTIIFEPYPNQNKMLVSIGSSCNVCNEADQRRAKILEYDFDTGKVETFAKGLRNSVFMAIHPVSGKIWATEMGRDLLGDDIPPDEINIIEKGKNYGWPNCYGQNIHDDNFDKNTYIRNPCMEPFETPAHIDLQAHSAPLGLAFIPEEGWPEDYWYNMLVSYHGSWNRTVPTGYKVVRFKLDSKGNYLGQEDFITGWIKDGKVYGRPVDILVQPGGTIFISDDKAGVIYKVVKR